MRAWQFIFLWLGLIIGLTSHGAENPETSAPLGMLDWQAKSNRVDARLQAWPLNRVLSRVAKATGWEIFIEPGTQQSVTAGFTGLSQREALSRLLGDLSFALLPRTNATARLLIYHSTRESATERVPAEEDPNATRLSNTNRIPNELIIRLKPGSKLKPEELARILGGKLVGSLEEFGAYRLRFDSAAAAETARSVLAEFPDQLATEYNYSVPLPDTVLQTSAAAAPLTLRPAVVGDKEGVVVALIDTAVQPLPKEYEAFLRSRTSVVEATGGGDKLLHGTSMFEVMLRGAEAADSSGAGSRMSFRSYDVYGARETTSSFDIARALTLAAADGATIFNLSLGSYDQAPLLADVISSISQQGGLVFAAAGNQPGTTPTYPAADPGAVAVTALGRDGQPASYANTGSFVDLGAPGSALVSYNGRSYLISGTSSATAYTSGFAASTAAKTGIPLSKVLEELQRVMGFQPRQP